MFDPSKWFGRAPYQQVGGDSDDIEVDQISFTSSCSSGEHEGYVTAMDTTSHREEGRFQLSSTDLISFADELNVPGTSEDNSILSSDSPVSSSQVSNFPPPFYESSNLKESIIVRNSIFWFTENEVDASKLVLPISNKGRVCRFDHDVDDNQLETICRTLQISMGLSERSRWLNHMARNPALSELARELDEEFPSSFSESVENDEEDLESVDQEIESRPPATSFSSSSCAGSFRTVVCPTYGALTETNGILDDTTMSNLAPGMARTVVPPQRGIQGVEIQRRINETPSAVCSAIIRQVAEKDPPMDRRMIEWMRGFAEVDTWIQEVAPASRKYDKYSFEVPPLTEDWILTVHKQPAIRQGLESQQWKCAACRQSLHTHNINDKDTCPKFCDYYGLFFCSLCHGGEKSIIPSRAITQWNFAEHPVSDRAIRFLRAVRETPVFKVRDLPGDLLKKNKALRAVVELRQKLKHMEGFIKVRIICLDASNQVFEFGNLSTMFANMDRYLLENDDLFSLNDLQRVYNKDLISLLEPLAKRGREHILHCKRCRLQAPVCVRCNDMTDRLFPFEERAVAQCDGCGHLSHSPKCPRRDVPRDTHCPKCARLKSRSNGMRTSRIIGDVV
ncbi:Protein CBG13311 [Caenorhabditis briggsae]|uniref:Protein CBG13311 n=1 Tax=Caenorhabditis briggsae TaxID=6238 RepID=A8XHJ6_CAEBR|nr:Protein CBG13311 [Caenorhabditis briggsae]CAP32120.2 Protein CBG13311 [Caenorhabditis briggsae]